jgi:hypothetical protein
MPLKERLNVAGKINISDFCRNARRRSGRPAARIRRGSRGQENQDREAWLHGSVAKEKGRQREQRCFQDTSFAQTKQEDFVSAKTPACPTL